MHGPLLWPLAVKAITRLFWHLRARLGRAVDLGGFGLQHLVYLGQPSFSRQIQRRKQRWSTQGRPAGLAHLANKEKGQAFARLHDIPVPDRYGLLDKITDLPEIADLEPAFVLKPTASYSSRNVFLVRNGCDLLTGQPIDRADILQRIGQDSREKFVLEELLTDQNGRVGAPLDYKFYCFGEKIVLLHVYERNSTLDPRQNRIWFLDRSFRPVRMRVRKHVRQEPGLPPRPENYAAMLELVQRIGRLHQAFVRIDVYATPRGAVLGEFTPFPFSGRGLTRRADVFLGRHWVGEEGC